MSAMADLYRPEGDEVKLNSDARATLRDHDVSIAAWARRHFGDGVTTWHGDACACPDDRCIGYHHDEHDECGCLSALLAEVAGSRTT